MTKYIYHSKQLRCRVKPAMSNEYIVLQLEKRFGFVWLNVFYSMYVQEIEKSASDIGYHVERMPFFKGSIGYVDRFETYLRGTLNLHKRIDVFFAEYLNAISVKRQTADKIREL